MQRNDLNDLLTQHLLAMSSNTCYQLIMTTTMTEKQIITQLYGNSQPFHLAT